MTDVDLADLWRAWSVFGPWRLRPGQHRAQNVVQIVDTQSGSFVLRVYQHQRDVKRIKYEHALVHNLQVLRLPFTVPVPVPTGSGDTVISVPTNAGPMFASLWPLVPGGAPRVGDLEQIRQAAHALGVLDQALADVDVDRSADVTPPARHGDLVHLHPFVADPLAAVAALPVEAGSKARMGKLLQNLLADVPQLYRTLPQQIVHNDYDGSNILMNGANVGAVLDWEFSTHDLRALDLVVALHGWSAELRGSGQEWNVIDIFGRAYVITYR